MSNQNVPTPTAQCDRSATRLEDLRSRLDSCARNFLNLNERCLDVISRAEGSPTGVNDTKEVDSPCGLLNGLNSRIDDLDHLHNELSDRIAYFESTI